MDRARNLERLRGEEFDVLIVGGGINGAGVARDLMLRAGSNLRVALVEQRQFGSGTSGKNSQLIHGGLRYLEQLAFGLVRESLRERATLLRIAPDLVKPQAFLLPMYSMAARLYYGAGLWLYDRLAGAQKIAPHRSLSSAAVMALEPALAAGGLAGGAIFFDARVDSARFVLANIQDAARNGAVVVNYVRVDRAMRATDMLSGETFPIRARRIVEAAGAWGPPRALRLVRGSHIVLPRLNESDNAIAHFEESGRILFVIPWGSARQLSLVGTTDVDHGASPDDVRISAGEMQYLLGVVHRLFPGLRELRPISAFSSLRPLVAGDSASATRTSREHRIWRSEDGVVHIAGGKFTTYRLMSEEAVDMIAPELAKIHVTAEAPLKPGQDDMAQRLADVLFVSTYLGYEQRWTAETLRSPAEEMGARLGWDERRIRREIELVLRMAGLPSD